MSDTHLPPSGKDPAPAVTRALRILSLLEEAAGQPLSLSDIARRLGVAKSSTSNICAVLEEGRMVRRVEGGYLLGVRTAELGGAFTAGFNQIREFFSVVESIPTLRRQTVQVVMRDGVDALYLARHEGRQDRVGTPLGSRLPLVYSASGIAILSAMPDDAVDDVLASSRVAPDLRGERGVLSVRRNVREARERGYAIDRGVSFPGVVGVAAPLEPWRPSDPALALGVALLEGEASDEAVESVGSAVREAVQRLTNPFRDRVLRRKAHADAAGEGARSRT